MSAPTAGQYTFDVATGEYGFAAADVATRVFIDYRYTVQTGKSLSVRNIPDFEFTGYADEFGEVCYWSANE
ncbi:hypothetical protein [Pseudomonas fluorescens]|uniref:Uncharacterized protein n=1 Tax=Pseudomonas fluorescens TaxID=294 RepID=A0A5E7A8A6_PSEFL|nr:hypothetical protein [Pseudomonas fluorescens]VVN71643.1 hypothetical protein PS833_00454 [Pseudomonas fluorescens]VVP82557.1 hypothetical protein PS914_02341 [Pseudomonas fluorescens]